MGKHVKWIQVWEGSGEREGFSIREDLGLRHGDEIAYLGRIDRDEVAKLVSAHNTTPPTVEVIGEPLSGMPFAILDEEMDALRRFTECAEDGEGYDVSKKMMKRLAEIGLLNHLSAGYYEHTNFGLAVLHGEFRTPPTVAAALRKAADIVNEFCGDDIEVNSWTRNLCNQILAIPHDDSALMEICMRVAEAIANLTAKLSAAEERVKELEKESVTWRSINTASLTDDLIWLYDGIDSIEGPRTLETDDCDRYMFWAPCTWPSTRPIDTTIERSE